jgi:hypothetical protein
VPEPGFAFRHVVMFQWAAATTAEQRTAAVDALHSLRESVAHLCSLRVGTDAGLAPGNYDVVVVADFPRASDYALYVEDPGHQRVVREYLGPYIASRAAVQHPLD